MNNISIVISSLAGGTGYLLQQVSMHQAKKGKVTVISLTKNADQKFIQNLKKNKNINLINSFSNELEKPIDLIKFVKIVRKSNCKKIISFDNRSNFYCFTYQLINKVEWISSIHGLEGAFSFKWRNINRFILKFSKTCIVPSKAVKNKILQQKLLNKTKIKVVHNGVETIKKPINRMFYSKKNIFLVANFYSKIIKGHEVAINSMSYLPDNHRLILIGSGAYQDYFKKFVRKKKLHKKISFLGFKNKDKIFKLFKKCNCLIAPSYTEAFGISLIEAMSRGVPVVASDVGGIKEILKNNYNGLIIRNITPEKLAKSVLKITKSKILNEKFGMAGFNEVNKKFSLARMLSEYDKIIQKSN